MLMAQCSTPTPRRFDQRLRIHSDATPLDNSALARELPTQLQRGVVAHVAADNSLDAMALRFGDQHQMLIHGDVTGATTISFALAISR